MMNLFINTKKIGICNIKVSKDWSLELLYFLSALPFLMLFVFSSSIKHLSMPPFATLQSLHGSVLGSQFLGQDHHFFLNLKKSSKPRHRKSTCEARAKFNIFEIMGGRGLCNGEKGLEQELMKKKRQEIDDDDDEKPQQPAIIAAESSDSKQEDTSAAELKSDFAVPEDGFEKEMMGLTGGFPGGEKGLQRFIDQNPPHKPASVPFTSNQTSHNHHA